MAKPLKLPPTPEEQKKIDAAFMKDVTNSMMTSMMMVVSMIVFLPMILRSFGTGIASASAQTQALTLQGHTDSRELHATGYLQWIDLVADPPYTPWIRCFLINDGPSAVELAINQPNERFVLGAQETRTIDRGGAEIPILAIFYVAPLGQTAHIRITGEY